MKPAPIPPAEAHELEHLVRGVADNTVPFEDLVAALMPLILGTKTLPADKALTLSTVLIEIEQDAWQGDQLYSMVNTHGAASVALNEAGQILALNPAAVELFSVTTGDGLAALRILRNTYHALEQRLARVAGPSLIEARTGDAPGPLTPVLMSAVYHPVYQACVLTALQYPWPDSIAQGFAEVYSLSRSELQVLGELSRGTPSEVIAARRNRSVGTVRQQIKSILYKMRVSTQLEAATLAATAVAAASTAGTAGTQTTGMVPHHPREAPLQTSAFMRRRRRIGWRRFGDPTGRPVLYLHGPSFGAGEYDAERRLAQRHTLNVYALERPGYGRTEVPGKKTDILRCHVQDILALLDQEGLESVTVLAHEVALIPALELAHHHQDRVLGILAVSAAPPFLEVEQIAAMPPHQGIFILAARHAPWLARLMVRLLLVRARQLGPQRWTDVIFQGVPGDVEVMGHPPLQPGIIATYSFYLNQMGAGFEQDLQMMLKDWSHRITGCRTPLHLLHGGENAATPVAHLEVFRKLRRDISFTAAPGEAAAAIEVVDRAGLTLAISHVDLIYKRLAAMVDRAHSTPPGHGKPPSPPGHRPLPPREAPA